MEHGDRNLFAHQERYRDSDEKCADDALNHHEPRHPEAIEKSDEAEQETGQQAVNRVRLQVIGGCRDDSRIVREYGSHQIPSPEGNRKHHNRQSGRNPDRIQQSLSCTPILSGSDILCGKGSHRLHKRSRDQHNKSAYLLGDTDAGRRSQTKAVDNRLQHKERDSHKKVLERDRKPEGGHFPDHRPVQSDITGLKLERQLFLAQNDKRDENTQSLREDRGQCRAGCTHMEDSDKQQISRNVKRACDHHRHKRCPGISYPTKDTADEIVGNNESRTNPADTDVGCGLGKSFLRGMHHSAELVAHQRDDQRENRRDQSKETDAPADHGTTFPSAAFPYPLAEKNGCAHRETGHEICDGHHHLRAGRNR